MVVYSDPDVVVARAALRTPSLGEARGWQVRRVTSRLLAATAIAAPGADAHARRRALEQLVGDPRVRVEDRVLGGDRSSLVLAGADCLRLPLGVAAAESAAVGVMPPTGGSTRRVLYGVAGWNDWRLEWRGDGPPEWSLVTGFAAELIRRIDRLIDQR